MSNCVDTNAIGVESCLSVARVVAINVLMITVLFVGEIDVSISTSC